MANLDTFKGATTAPATKSVSELMMLMQPQFKAALPAHLKDNAERYMRLALTEMRRNPALNKCDPYSVLGCAMVAAQLGLEPGPLGRAYLIPYGKECTFVPGWKGLLELTSRSGRAGAWSGVLYIGQKHEYEQGDNPRLKIIEDSDEDDPDKIAYFWSVGRVKGSDYPLIERWTRSKVAKHRDRFNKVGQRHYSFQHFEMYGRKVPLLQVLKYLPATPELEAAYMLDAGAERGHTLNIKTAADAIDGVFENLDESPNAAPQGSAEAAMPGSGESPAEGLSPAGAAPVEPMTYAKVMERMNKAKDADILDAEADLIRGVASPEQRKELTQAYKARRAELTQ